MTKRLGYNASYEMMPIDLTHLILNSFPCNFPTGEQQTYQNHTDHTKHLGLGFATHQRLALLPRAGINLPDI